MSNVPQSSQGFPTRQASQTPPASQPPMPPETKRYDAYAISRSLELADIELQSSNFNDFEAQNSSGYESLSAIGIVPPAAFASESERFEWARLEVDAEALIPTTEEIELAEELARQEALRMQPRSEKYIEHLRHTSADAVMNENSLQNNERFRRVLVKLIRRGIKQHMKDEGIDPEPSPSFSLSCVGSLRYGLALRSSEMDLLFSPRSLPSQVQQDIVNITQRLLRKQGLEVVQTTCWDSSTPVLKVTDPDSYSEIIRHHMQASQNRDMPIFDWNLASEIFETTASSYRCNIFFSSNPLMDHSANILQCYSLCDSRVKKMGHFIRSWAHARNISSPRQGTLSGKGYLYLLIHYLRDVADPPVLPNLQTCNLGRREPEVNDEQVIHYWSHKEEIAAARDAGMLTQNTETVPALIRGFFEYYCGKSPRSQCTPRRKYFHWKNHSLILRNDGGSVPKHLCPSREWTGLDTPQGHDFICIQDLIDTRCNIGSSVTLDGWNRIRSEFARARLYIEHASVIPEMGWAWKRRDGSIGEPFFDAVRIPTARV